jgi:hypothetical protein
MSDKAPGKPSSKKPGKTLKEKRSAKKLKRTAKADQVQTFLQRRH